MANSFDNELETPGMETLSSLAENLVYRLPGCDDLTVRKSIQDVYRDFCRRSCCLHGWRQFTLDTNVRTLKVSPMFGGIVDAIVEVMIDGRAVGREMYSTEPGGKIELDERMWPAEGTDEESFQTLSVMFVEIPKLSSEIVPSWFVQEYGDVVCSGVLARLMSATGKAWSDPAQAVVERTFYENGVDEARLRYHSGNTDGHLGTASNFDELL